jgi:RecJ-like exonuclease
VEGTITGVTPYYTAKLYTLEDDQISLGLYVHNGLVYADNRTLNLNLLQRVRVTAGISKWGNLSLRSYDNIEVIENGIPLSVDIEDIQENLDGKIVELDGKIIFVELEGKDTSRRLTLSGRRIWLNGSDNPPIWLSGSVYKLLSEGTQKLLRRGSTVTDLQGKVEWAKFEVEFYGIPEPELMGGEYEPPFVENTAEITRENKNDFVTVQGEVVNIENDYAGADVPNHKKLVLEDELGGTIEIWIQNIVYERLPDPPSIEDTVRVVGKVVEREGEIQLQPGVPNDVVEVKEV